MEAENLHAAPGVHEGSETTSALEVKGSCSRSHNRDPARKGRRLRCGGARTRDPHWERPVRLMGTTAPEGARCHSGGRVPGTSETVIKSGLPEALGDSPTRSWCGPGH